MIGLASLAVGVCVALSVASLLGVPGPRLRDRRPGRSRPSLQARLNQAGASISAARYRVVVGGSALVVALVLWSMTRVVSAAAAPALAVLMAPRYWFARARRHELTERAAAWPDALRDLVAHLASTLTLNQALIELGRTGPEALRPAWRRFETNVNTLDVETALDVAQTELADPMSDRVLEMLRMLHRKGGGEVAMAILDDLTDTIGEDGELAESLHTAQYELRVQAIAVVIMPFALLAVLCAGNSGFRRFYASSGGMLVVALGAAMAFAGWTMIDRLGRLPIEPRVITVPSGDTREIVAWVDSTPRNRGRRRVCATVMAAASLVWPPPRRLAARLRPYTQVARSRLGTGQPETALLEASREERSSWDQVFGPLVRRAAEALASLLDVGGRDATALRLRQAGFGDMTVEQYRLRQLGYTVGLTVAGLALGVLLGRSTALVLLLGGLMAFVGAAYWRSKVTKAIDGRRLRMRVELYTVCQLLALHTRTAEGGPTEAVRQTLGRCVGPVSDELAEALALISRGQDPGEAYGHIARVTPEPTAARLYRTLAASARGGDTAPALLALATAVRSQRRQDLARLAAKRRVAMVGPLVVVMGPIMILFIAAAIPSLVFKFH